MTRDEANDFFAAHRGDIERISGIVARRHGLAPQHAAVFTQWVLQSLIEADYSVIRRLPGDVAARTYLSVVIIGLARQFKLPALRPRPAADVLHSTSRLSAGDMAAVAAAMDEIRIVAAGVVVGTTRLVRRTGIATATFLPRDSYSLIAAAAQRPGAMFDGTILWDASRGDVTAWIAADWAGVPLSLEDSRGQSIAAASVVVVDEVKQPRRRVVVDFRLAATPVAAVVRPHAPTHQDTDTRPAA